jgi:hypothetical protein
VRVCGRVQGCAPCVLFALFICVCLTYKIDHYHVKKTRSLRKTNFKNTSMIWKWTQSKTVQYIILKSMSFTYTKNINPGNIPKGLPFPRIINYTIIVTMLTIKHNLIPNHHHDAKSIYLSFTALSKYYKQQYTFYWKRKLLLNATSFCQKTYQVLRKRTTIWQVYFIYTMTSID